MKKQIYLSHRIQRSYIALSIALLCLTSLFVAVTAMASPGNSAMDTSQTLERPLLTEAPTASDTTSLTNGIYMQDPTTKTFRKIISDTVLTKTTTATRLSGAGNAGSVSANSLANSTLYVDPSLRQQGRQEHIASQPTGRWFGGWNADVQGDVSRIVRAAARTGTVPTLVAYNIPVRDCGSYSAGGSNSSAAYRNWIQAFANGIGQYKAIVVLEPDALPGLDCLSGDGQRQRLSDISFAVSVLSRTGAVTYLDAGNYTWQSVNTMAQRLKSANVSMARGFSLNVSGYAWSDNSIAYGKQLVSALGGVKGFVIDTSRNGNGPAPDNEWCNPRGRALGRAPSTNTGISGLDAYLWVKVPGESDGTCGGGPAAGEWWDEIANEMIRNVN